MENHNLYLFLANKNQKKSGKYWRVAYMLKGMVNHYWWVFRANFAH